MVRACDGGRRRVGVTSPRTDRFPSTVRGSLRRTQVTAGGWRAAGPHSGSRGVRATDGGRGERDRLPQASPILPRARSPSISSARTALPLRPHSSSRRTPPPAVITKPPRPRPHPRTRTHGDHPQPPHFRRDTPPPPHVGGSRHPTPTTSHVSAAAPGTSRTAAASRTLRTPLTPGIAFQCGADLRDGESRS
jgi:hypothetical protein